MAGDLLSPTSDNSYDASSIQVLEDMEHVRLRPGMYIGGTPFFPLVAIVFGVLKRSIFRCLGVMVSMGWGIVRDSLGMALAKIIFLGMMYCGLTAARDVFTLVAVEEVHSISTAAEEELIDIAVVLTIAIFAINFIFYCWIIRSLGHEY